MAVRSDQVYSGPAGAPGTAVLYTVPLDRTLILKRITAYGLNTTPGSANLLCNGLPVRRFSLAQDAFVDAETWIVLTEGQTISFQGGTSGGYALTLSGALLLGDPA